MDQQGSNKKKAKNWLYRFLKIKNRLHDRSSVSDIDSEVSRRYAFEHPDSKPHRNSFRKSLKKMHSRVKSCMFSQENNTPKRPVTVTDLPCSSQLSEYEIYRNTTPPPVPHRPQMPSSSEFYYASAIPQRRSCTPPLATDGPPVVQEPPRVSPPRESPPLEVRTHRIPTDEIVSLSNCYWYWGPMPTAEAEEKLQYKPDGTFLVRDSASTNYLFSISFRSVGKTMHARIEYSRGRYNLCGTYAEGFATVTELIRDAMKTSENGIYCYSRRGEQAFEFPVRLTKPISRYTEVRSLKHLCKFTIRQYTNMNDIPKLPLPTVLHGYLLEKPYF